MRLLQKPVPIIPIWDDHDYGLNDAGREYKMKEASAQLFFEAFNFPTHHEAHENSRRLSLTDLGAPGKAGPIHHAGYPLLPESTEKN